MSDNNIKKMANMLQSGATMLDDYCPKCNNILFRLKDQRIFCPVCELEVKKIKEGEPSVNYNVKNQEMNSFSDLHNFYVQLFEKLTSELNNVKDLVLIEKYLDLLNKTLDIIKKLRELK
jgi:uncharacterized Zn finger protein (UPF0148 family)